MKISEIYHSVQGEGPNVGESTIFVRFAGCNLRCAGWPCDTQHAIDAKNYRQEWKDLNVDAIIAKIQDVANGNQVRICYTGGEPFLQKKLELQDLTGRLLSMSWVTGIDCFSNGTIIYPQWAIDSINFVMDWKLPGSGEASFSLARTENARNLTCVDAVKFTIASYEDFKLAMTIWAETAQENPEVQFYAGVVWGKLTSSMLVEWMFKQQLPWKLNVQIHNYIWPREQRGI